MPIVQAAADRQIQVAVAVVVAPRQIAPFDLLGDAQGIVAREGSGGSILIKFSDRTQSSGGHILAADRQIRITVVVVVAPRQVAVVEIDHRLAVRLVELERAVRIAVEPRQGSAVLFHARDDQVQVAVPIVVAPFQRRVAHPGQDRCATLIDVAEIQFQEPLGGIDIAGIVDIELQALLAVFVPTGDRQIQIPVPVVVGPPQVTEVRAHQLLTRRPRFGEKAVGEIAVNSGDRPQLPRIVHPFAHQGQIQVAIPVVIGPCCPASPQAGQCLAGIHQPLSPDRSLETDEPQREKTEQDDAEVSDHEIIQK